MKKGSRISEEHRAKLIIAATGRRRSAGSRKKQGKSMTGNNNSLGFKHSVETCDKMSLSHTGKPSGALGMKHTKEWGILHSERMKARHLECPGWWCTSGNPMYILSVARKHAEEMAGIYRLALVAPIGLSFSNGSVGRKRKT
jgi:hypothetical protein